MFRGSARTDAQLALRCSPMAPTISRANSRSTTSLTPRGPSTRRPSAKPDHVETNNSYGYRLLELGEDVERAIAMIETAYASSSQEPHIIDSLGWARYKQGRLEDWTDPLTGRMQPGALSLLRREDRGDRGGPDRPYYRSDRRSPRRRPMGQRRPRRRGPRVDRGSRSRDASEQRRARDPPSARSKSRCRT